MKIFTLGLILLVSVVACSITPTTEQAKTQQRVAVVIGNENYNSTGTGDFTFGGLDGPKLSADEIAKILQKQGFTVYVFENLSRDGIYNAVKELNNALTEKDGIGLFFFSGHGYQLSQETKNEDSYLIPINFKPLNREDSLFDTKFKKQTVALSKIIDELNTPKNQDKNIIVMLDACRGEGKVRGILQSDSIFYGASSELSPGFSSTTKIGIPPNFILSFATESGDSSIGPKGDLSVYVKLLTKYLPRADLSIYDVFDLVNKDARRQAERQAEGMEQKFQIATFLHGEDQRGFFKETYLSGRLPIIAPPTRP